jgi:hypothetical protein
MRHSSKRPTSFAFDQVRLGPGRVERQSCQVQPTGRDLGSVMDVRARQPEYGGDHGDGTRKQRP